MSRLIVIHDCQYCPYFDNDYYEYAETCTKLDRKIEGDYTHYAIPEDCPLPEEDE